MRGARTRRRRNPRFAALCLLLIFAAVGAAVWLWAGRGLPGEGVEVPDYVQADLLTVNPWSRPGTPLEKIDGIVIHYVGNPGTTAKANGTTLNPCPLGRRRHTPPATSSWGWRVRSSSAFP